MNKNIYKVIVTGGAGFIGSNLINSLFSYKEKLVICDNPEFMFPLYLSNQWLSDEKDIGSCVQYLY